MLPWLIYGPIESRLFPCHPTSGPTERASSGCRIGPAGYHGSVVVYGGYKAHVCWAGSHQGDSWASDKPLLYHIAWRQPTGLSVSSSVPNWVRWALGQCWRLAVSPNDVCALCRPSPLRALMTLFDELWGAPEKLVAFARYSVAVK